MKPQTLLLTFCLLTLHSFSGKAQDVFPDVVNAAQTKQHQRVKGTRLFVNAPAAYKPLENLIRLQRDDNTYLQVVEIPNTGFSTYKSKVSRQEMERQGARIDVYEPVRFNGLDGIYFEGPSKTNGETKIGLAFGDNAFVTIVVGVVRTDDAPGRRELRTILSNAYYDKSFPLNPLELARFRFDETITGFHFATKMSNMYIYSPRGDADLKGQTDFSSFQLMPVDAGSFDKIRELMETIVSRMEQQGNQLSNIRKNEFQIDGHLAYEITMDMTDRSGSKAVFCQVGIFNARAQSGLIFSATDTDKGVYFERFRATARSIRF